MKAENDFSTDQLYENKIISVHARNICANAGLLTLSRIVDFYKQNRSFVALPNCGEHTEKELVEICNSIQEVVTDTQLCIYKLYKLHQNIVEDNEKMIRIYRNFSEHKKKILHLHIEYLISKLSVRVHTGITILLNKLGMQNKKMEEIYSHRFNYIYINNIGEGSMPELLDFKKNISLYIITLYDINGKELNTEHSKQLIGTLFKGFTEVYQDIVGQIIDPEGKIKLFSLINILIEYDFIFKKNEKKIFFSRYSKDIAPSLYEIATELNITHERVRQIKHNIETKLTSYFRFVSIFNSYNLINYEIDKKIDGLITIDKELADKINNAECVGFSRQFYCLILAMLVPESHSVFGIAERLATEYPGPKDFSNFYLITNDAISNFNFIAFANAMFIILNKPIRKSYVLNFEQYIIQFIKNDGKRNLILIKEVCQEFVFREFGLVVKDGLLYFERTTKENLTDYVREILEELGEMTKIETLNSIVKKKYPLLKLKEHSVRSVLTIKKEYFFHIYTDKNSIYGLKKWQEVNRNLKSGTLSDLVEEFLLQHEEPQHIDDIAKYVMNYRVTSGYGILNSIRIGKNNRFVFLKNGYIGLKSKNHGNLT